MKFSFGYFMPTSDTWRQFVAISPVYILQLCYGMSSGYPAIVTPQLNNNCQDDTFSIDDDQESWIGGETLSFNQFYSCFKFLLTML